MCSTKRPMENVPCATSQTRANGEGSSDGQTIAWSACFKYNCKSGEKLKPLYTQKILHMASSSREAGLFTTEYLVSIGGNADPESCEMVRVLNLLTSFWGYEAIGHMEKFLNLIKSKTDELSVTLRPRGDSRTEVASGASEAKRPRVLETDKKDALQRLKESEAKVQSLEHSLKNLQEKYSELEKKTRVSHEKGILNLFAASYTKKCVDLDNLKDESIRHAIWFNEHTNTSMAAKLDLEKNLSLKENQVKELQKAGESAEKKNPVNKLDDVLKVN